MTALNTIGELTQNLQRILNTEDVHLQLKRKEGCLWITVICNFNGQFVSDTYTITDEFMKNSSIDPTQYFLHQVQRNYEKLLERQNKAAHSCAGKQ